MAFNTAVQAFDRGIYARRPSYHETKSTSRTVVAMVRVGPSSVETLDAKTR